MDLVDELTTVKANYLLVCHNLRVVRHLETQSQNIPVVKFIQYHSYTPPTLD